MNKERISSEVQGARSTNLDLLSQPEVPNGVTFCIITGHRPYSDIEKVVESIQRLKCPFFEIIIIGTVPSSIQGCIALSNRKAVDRGWYGSLRNQGAAAAKFTTIVFLNDDVTLDPSFGSVLFEQLLDSEQNNNWFVAQPRILNPDGTRYWDWATYGGPRGHCLLAYSHKDPGTYLQSSAYVIKRSVASSVLWQEETSCIFPLDEVDYTRTLRAAGFGIVCASNLTTHHLDPSFIQIDDYPRKIHARFKLEPLGNGLFGRGFYPPEINGARLLEEKAEIIISKNLLTTSGVLSFLLQSHAQDLYDEWPLTVKLLNGNSEVATVTFKRGGERHHVHLPISASGHDLILSLVANSTIISKLSINHRDDKVFSVFLGELTYEQKSNLFSLVEPISAEAGQIYTKKSEREECVVISPHLSSLAIGSYSRRLISNLIESGLKIEVDTYLSEASVIQELTKSEDSRSFWRNIHRTQVSGGTCITSFPLEIASNPRVIRRIRELHSNCRYSILLTYATRLGQLEDLHLAADLFDEVWLPSEYQAKIFTQYGINREIIRVVPPGVDTELYNPESTTPLPLALRGDFTIICDIPLSRDSGWQELLLAYFTQFTRADDVALILRVQEFGTFAHVAMEQIRMFLRNNDFDHPGAPALYLFDASRITEDQIPKLYALADIFVLPNAIEVWPYFLLRPMALGLPVIASNVGSNPEFVDDQVGALITIKESNDSLESALAPKLNHRPQVSALGKLMREAFENREATAKRSEAARQRVTEKWPLATTTELIKQRVFHAFDHTQITLSPSPSPSPTNSKLTESQGINSKTSLSSQIECSVSQTTDSSKLQFETIIDVEYGSLYGIGVKAENLIEDIRLGHTPAIYTQHFLQALSDQKTVFNEKIDRKAEITLYAQTEEKVEKLKELFPNYQTLVLHDEGAKSTFEIVWDCSRTLYLDDSFNPPRYKNERDQKLSSRAIWTRVIDDLLPISRRDSYFDRWSSEKKSRFIATLSEEARNADHFFTFSRQAETLIAKTLDIDTQKITVLSGAPPDYSHSLNLEASEQSKLRMRSNTLPNGPYIISAGLLSAHRNIPSLLLAIEQVRVTTPVDLVFLHPPDEEIINYYQTLCIRNRLQGVRFIANSESNQTVIRDSLLTGASAMVFATSHASVFLEPLAAAQTNCTIISPPSRELSEIIGNRYFMIADESPEELAKAIIKVVRHPGSTEQLRVQAAQHARRHSWGFIGQNIIQKLITLVNAKLKPNNNSDELLLKNSNPNDTSKVDLSSLFT